MERFEIAGLLAWADAPAEVRAWSESEPGCRLALEAVDDVMGLLERAPSPAAAVWTAAVLTVPLDLVATACAVVVETEAEPLGEIETLVEAIALMLETAAGDFDGEALLSMAERCEALEPATAGYRGDAARAASVGRAAGACCRALEALGAARVRITFERDASARNRAALLGMGGVLAAARVAVKELVKDAEQPLVLARPAFGAAPPPHDLRAVTGLLADALTFLVAGRDDKRVRDAFLDALAEE